MRYLVPVLLIVLIVMGISSSMQSYATAQQAQAQIEVARVAQANAAGNLVSLIVLGAMVVLILLAVVGIGLLYVRRLLQLKKTGASSVRVGPTQIRQPSAEQKPLLTQDQVNMLIQMKMLEMLQSSRPELPAPKDDPPADEPLSWLKN